MAGLRQNRPARCLGNITLGDYTDFLGDSDWIVLPVREKRIVKFLIISGFQSTGVKKYAGGVEWLDNDRLKEIADFLKIHCTTVSRALKDVKTSEN